MSLEKDKLITIKENKMMHQVNGKITKMLFYENNLEL